MSKLENRIDQLSPLQRAVYALKETQARLDALERQLNEPIALCGMACRFPGGANDPDSYWRMLCNGIDAISEIPDGRWDADAYYDPDPRTPGKMNCRRGGFLDNIDQFDNHFFEISDQEAQQLDPQQRMLLELTWEALEDAGVPPSSLRGSRTGVFIGISVSEYSALITQDTRALGPLFSTGTALSIAANRISFAFDFHGPSVAVDTACSSSLVALHLASQAIRNGECTTAIVGGANLILSPAGTIVLTKSGFSAPDGCVRAFDRSASGYVRSEGAGVLVLKSLSAAEAAGDPIYAVLRGSAVHQTGRANGISAPVGRVQEEALRSACEQAAISPARISYIEAQGTGTLLGDAIEAKALGAALSDGRSPDNKCLLGSVKTNIGHLEAASGIASVMKVALALKHGQVPPSLHFNSPSPMIPFDEMPLRVATQVENLPDSDEPKIASINGFGYGGSNAHIILEESKAHPEDTVASVSDDTQRTLAISARTDAALSELAEGYRDFLHSANGVEDALVFWRDVVATAAHRREHHDCRLALSANSPIEAAVQLDAFLKNEKGNWSAGHRPLESKTTSAAVSQAKEQFESDGDQQQLLRHLYIAGADAEFQQLTSANYLPIRLPSYAWQKRSLWVAAANPWSADAAQGEIESSIAINAEALAPRPNLSTPYIAPESPLELRLAESWSRVLLVQPVGVCDNFFELGGKSLQAAILVSELQQLLKIQVDLVALFEAQTIRELSEYLEKHHGPAVAAALENAALANDVTDKNVERPSRITPLPLSSGQQRFWFLDQLNPGAPIYNVHIAVPLIGDLAANVLQDAIRATIQRHESLRTIFKTDDNGPSQTILDSLEFDLETIDLSHLAGEAQVVAVREHSDQQANTAFHLNAAPLFRLSLLRLGNNQHTLVVTMHHIIVDGVSLAILLRDILEFYKAHTEASSPTLPELPIQYADFAAAQRDGLQGEAFEREMAYWRKQLDGITPLCLPTDRARSVSNGPRPGTFSFALPIELHQQLETICRKHRVTPFMFMLTAFNVLLHRYSGQDDLVIGIPVAGRGTLETQNLIGFFVNTLAQRNDLSGDPSFVECLQRVRQSTVESMVHQDLPFDEIAREIEPHREPNRHPVFQVLFNYLQEITQQTEGDLRIGDVPLEQPPHAGEFDLVLTLIEARATLNGIIGYNAEMFDESTIERVSKHFVRLVQSAIESTDRPLSQLDIEESQQRRRVLVDWNDTAAEYPFDKCLQHLFEEQVEQAPDSEAIICGDARLTYRELNDQANRLAGILRTAGIGPDELVGLCVRRSPDAVIGMIGILKAGAAFVPLDPALPFERIEQMVLDTGARIIVTQDDVAASLGKLSTQFISLTGRETCATLPMKPTRNPRCRTTPWNLAYVIFTSGSTGQPKGVLIEHRSIVNVVYGFIRSYDVTDVDRVLQNTSLSFDVSVNEIFPALCAGATVVISNDETQLDAVEIHRLLEKENITIAAATPSVLRHLNRAALPPSSLRLVLSGGEELSYNDVDRLLETAVVTNGYGPTEACICATCYPLNDTSQNSAITLARRASEGNGARNPSLARRASVSASTDAGIEHRTIPIGKPLANYRVYIVDDQLNAVPIGCPGELCIGGVGLARGYLNDEQLTAEKFVACPFEPGERMYRTGDRARWLPDGNVEFLGRVDRQIKMRGLRIEIGEVEAALAALDDVESASVVYHKPSAGEPRLVAYVVPDADRAAPIRNRLRIEATDSNEGLATHEMPNGLPVVHQNEGETEFLYRESFLHNCHLSHGIQLFDGCCVFDVGANIGVFSLHVAQKCQSPTIHAFEPIPSIHDKLQLNAKLHQLNLKAHQCGIADQSQRAEFVYFPDSGAMSGKFDTADDLQRRVADVASAVEEHLRRSAATELLETVHTEGVAYETIACEVRTISEVIRDEDISSIDLLKIDVEHGERAVLAGIADQDWPKIQQLVVEVHDPAKDGAVIAQMLAERGFQVETASVPVFEESNIVITHVYAKRRGWSAPHAATPSKVASSSADQFILQLSQPLRDRLPKYMLPSSFELLPDMPLTSSGKIDRARLPQPSFASNQRTDVTPPRTPIEQQLAAIWQELLSVKQVDIRDSFFELGGHSLLATQLVSRIKQAFDVELRLRSIFESSTIEGLAAEIEQATLRGDTAVTIRRAQRGDEIPLSAVQTSLWLVDQLIEGRSPYVMTSALRFRGPLNITALEKAINEVFRRHESLRTTFPLVDGVPVQQIAPFEPQSLGVLDVSNDTDPEQRMRDCVQEEARRPIDLVRGPVARVQLIKLAEQEHVFLMAGHHIVFDAWSAGVLAREIGIAYQAFANGMRSPLGELPIQYGDFAVWQGEYLESAQGEQLLAWWTDRLADLPELDLSALNKGFENVEVPPLGGLQREQESASSDAAPSESPSRIELPANLNSAIETFCREREITPFMLTLATFQIVLARRTGQHDFPIGTPVSGRTRPETQDLIGCFINPLVIRCELSDSPTFDELLDRVRSTTFEALDHQDLPFDRLVQTVNPSRDSQRHPIFQVLFDYQHEAPASNNDLSGLAIESIDLADDTPHFDLTVTVSDRDGRFSLSATFDKQRLDARIVAELLEDMCDVLQQAITDPQSVFRGCGFQPQYWGWKPQPRLAIPDLREPPKGGTTNETPTAHQMFEAWVERTPQAIAATLGNAQLTYEELDAKANRLAHYLRRQGVASENIIAIYLERSLEIPVAMLATLKAGAAFVLLDPDYPKARLDIVLEDCTPQVLITCESLANDLDYAGKTVCMDRERETIQNEPATNLAIASAPNDTAYVVYTSGSTGRPKGAINEHRGLSSAVKFDGEYFGITSVDHCLCRCPLGFDAFILEVLRPLVRGGQLVMCGRDEYRDPAALVRVIKDKRVTMIDVVPAVYTALLAENGFKSCDSLEKICLGGDVMAPEILHQHCEIFDIPIFNTYGPAEAAIWVTAWECDPQFRGSRLPIGKPNPYAHIYILDDDLNPVPAGVEGELYIGGAAVGRGYLNQADLTREKFVNDPFATEAEARMYRTGDRAQWLPDGNIDFLGRQDNQIKIQGVRIEIGEIESILKQHETVKDAVVDIRSSAAGKMIVAYIVAAGAMPVSSNRLRQFVSARLPQTMQPAAYVAIDEIPLSLNGKCDRRALPDPVVEVASHEPTATQSHSPTVTRLLEIWRHALGRDTIGPHDNFFEQGGHSLLAARVAANISEKFATEIPMRALFETPTIAELAQRVETAQLTVRIEAPAIEPISDRNRDFPLSAIQESLWTVHQLSEGTAPYGIGAALRLTGNLNADALQHAINLVVARHEALRTTYPIVDGRPVQRIGDPAQTLIETVDVSHLDSETALAEVTTRADAQLRRTIDIVNGPIVRTELFKIGDDDHVLVVTGHHIAFDAWSSGVLQKEIGIAYAAFAQGEASPPLPRLAVQYADYAVWQHQRLDGQYADSLLEYWRNKLDGVPTLNLPVIQRKDTYRKTSLTTRRTIPSELRDAVQDFCSQREVTPYMVMLAAFQVVLSRYSGQNDFAIGTPLAGRVRPEIADLVGCFISSVVVRCDLTGEPTFDDLVSRVKQTTLEAFDHQEMPFERLVQKLAPPRDEGRHPLFQVLFNYVQEASPSELISGIRVETLPLDDPISKFEFTVVVAETDEGLQLMAQADASRFDPSTLDGIVEQFQAVLASAIRQPERLVAEVSIASARNEGGEPLQARRASEGDGETGTPSLARRACITLANDDSHRSLTCVHETIAAQCERSPRAIAVVCGSDTLTYAELNLRAGQLANYMHRVGVQHQQHVGIHLQRSTNLAVAILAVMKAGATVVLLDPDYPAHRISLIIDDCQPDVVLTSESLAANIDSSDVRVVVVENTVAVASSRSTGAGSPSHGESRSSLQDAAYVNYTSGSTGKPKGAINTHTGLANLLAGEDEIYRFSAADRYLVRAPIGFDAFLNEFFRPLVSGGRMILANDDQYKDPAALVQLVQQQQVTFAQFVPAVLRAFLNEDGSQDCDSVRLVISGGEALTQDIVDLFRQRSGATLYNRYGPAETSIGVTAWECVDDYAYQAIPIGHPIRNVTAYVLDKNLQTLPTGVAGELCIGGAAVGRGYLHRPELTAEKFVPDPFADAPNARMYRTGDLCRMLPDGNIEFLGRTDDQVKIRGVRIELAEIESVLRQHEAVHDAVVDVRSSDVNEKMLVAYIVSTDGQSVTADEINQMVETRLPRTMKPAAYVFVDQVPLSLTGKTDRRSLPNPEEHHLVGRREYVAPRTSTEETLAVIWREVLNIDQLGVNDNFFDLGGHSLMVTRVVTRINEAFERELRPRVLFEHPTIAQLATRVDQSDEGVNPALAPIPVPDDRGRDFPLSFTQESLWSVAQIEQGRSAYAMCGALRMSGPLRLDAMQNTINEVRCRHEALRTTFPVVDGEPVQRVAPFEPQHLEVVDLTHIAEAERELTAIRLMEEARNQKIDLAAGPIVKIRLYRLASEQHILFVSGHHILFDGWSSELLPREIGQGYLTFAADQKPNLPQVPVQPADFALWQRDRLAGEREAELFGYWRETLADLPTLELPKLAEQSDDQPSQEAGASECKLPSEVGRRLNDFCRQHNVTPYMATLAALQIVLSRHSGQDKFKLGTPTAGRLRPELEHAIGCFINPVVIRADLSGNPTFVQHVAQVKQTAIGAFDHQELPFARLTELLAAETKTSQGPLYNVIFQLRHVGSFAPHLGDLSLSDLALKPDRSRGSLDVTVMERDGEYKLVFNYDPDQLTANQVRHMSEHFCNILDAGLTEPEIEIDRLPLLSNDERQLLLALGCGEQTDVSKLVAVQEMFEQWAARSPQATAVSYVEEQLTYGELNARANQLAHYLRRLGVGRGDLVGMYLQRSTNLPIAMLAILKAGGAFVPLDPDYPAQRVANMLEDCRPRVLLTTSQLGAGIESMWRRHPAAELGLEAPATARQVLLDGDREQIELEDRSNPVSITNSRDVVYVVYTSGSTGRPKGAINEHRSLSNLLTFDQRLFEVQPTDVCLCRSPVGFDVFIEDIFRPLAGGARLVLADADEYRDPAALVKLIQQQQVTIVFLVPAVYAAVLEEDGVGQCTSLRHVLVGGDVLPPELLRLHREMFDIPLVNGYGPAEAAIWATTWKCDSSNKSPRVSIGRPNSNVQIYILDDHLKPVSIGVEGELCIGGAAVCRGYLNRPELTAEKFLDDPFAEGDGRIYRTGDRARWLPDGNLDFLGRRDNQVKIRGVRIEIGEIESTIKQHAAVRTAVVDVRESATGDKSIVGYFIPIEAENVSIEALRHFVASRLPLSMQPSSYVRIDNIPLSPNGKVDRRALPEPVLQGPAAVADRAAAQTNTEEKLVQIWRELLGHSSFGRDDNFFEIGGHSLLAVKVMSRVRDEIETDVPVARVFAAPTIAGIAAAIDGVEIRPTPASPLKIKQAEPPHGDDHDSPLVRIGNGQGPPLFVVHGMGGYVTNLIPLGKALVDQYDVYSLEAQGPFDDRRPHDSIPEMGRYYLEAIRQRQPSGPYQLAGWSLGGTIAWEMTRQLIADGRSVRPLVLLDAHPLWMVDALEQQASVAARLAVQLGADFADIESLPDDHRWSTLLARARAFDGFGAKSIRWLVETCAAHLAAMNSYVPPSLDLDVVAIWAKQRQGRAPSNVWRKKCRGFDSINVPGHHYSMLEAENVEQLAAEIRRALDDGNQDLRKAG